MRKNESSKLNHYSDGNISNHSILNLVIEIRNYSDNAHPLASEWLEPFKAS